MATRCTIKIYDKEEAFYIYRHYDGYPSGDSGVPATLDEVQRYAWSLPRFEAMDFAAAIVRAWKSGAGDIYFTRDHSYHWDTEYQYNVTVRNQQIHLQIDKVGIILDRQSEQSRDRKEVFSGTLEKAITHFSERNV